MVGVFVLRGLSLDRVFFNLKLKRNFSVNLFLSVRLCVGGGREVGLSPTCTNPGKMLKRDNEMLRHERCRTGNRIINRKYSFFSHFRN